MAELAFRRWRRDSLFAAADTRPADIIDESTPWGLYWWQRGGWEQSRVSDVSALPNGARGKCMLWSWQRWASALPLIMSGLCLDFVFFRCWIALPPDRKQKINKGDDFILRGQTLHNVLSMQCWLFFIHFEWLLHGIHFRKAWLTVWGFELKVQKCVSCCLAPSPVTA